MKLAAEMLSGWRVWMRSQVCNLLVYSCMTRRRKHADHSHSLAYPGNCLGMETKMIKTDPVFQVDGHIAT